MKKCCVALMLLTSHAAFAAEPDRARFIEFGGTVVDGRLSRPATLYMESRHRARFDRLMTLKKSLQSALEDSRHDPELR
jgi:hypothetical protein